MVIDVLRLRGTRYEMGVQQGRIYRMLVGQLNVFKVFREMEMVQALIPPGVNKGTFNFVFYEMFKRGGKKLLKTIEEYYPEQFDRFLGMAEGFNLDPATYASILYLENLSGDCRMDMREPNAFNNAMDLIGKFFKGKIVPKNGDNGQGTAGKNGSSPQSRNGNGGQSQGNGHLPPMGCTVGMVYNDHSSFLLKNYDFPNELQDYQILRYSDNASGEGYKTLGLTEGPSLGMITGVNEKGLAMSVNAGYSKDLRLTLPPATVTLQAALESCDSAEDARDFVKSAPIAVGWIFSIIDSNNHGYIVERTPSTFGIREMNKTDYGDYLGQGNTFLCEAPQSVQFAWGTTWNVRVIKGWEVLGRSKFRGEQMEQKLRDLLLKKANKEKIEVEELHAILASHNDDEPDGGDTTICRHSPLYKTLSGHIIDAKTRSFYICDGNPCKAERMIEFPFKFDYETPKIRFLMRNLPEGLKKKLF